MAHFQIAVNDDNTKMIAKADRYEIADGWVSFLEDDKQVISVPQARILFIATIPDPARQEPLRITITPPVFAGDADEVAKVTKRIIKDYAGHWGAL